RGRIRVCVIGLVRIWGIAVPPVMTVPSTVGWAVVAGIHARRRRISTGGSWDRWMDASRGSARTRAGFAKSRGRRARQQKGQDREGECCPPLEVRWVHHNLRIEPDALRRK